MTESVGEVAPLWITPLVKCSREETDVGRYETLQRLVSACPADENAEIETLLQVFIGPESDIPLWKRVVVRSGPLCPLSVVHASFQLPEGDDDLLPSGNLLAWVAFPEEPDHFYLSVLASPTSLCIWDVYPDENNRTGSSVGEGHSIALPFEASSIHALEGGQSGLLIQRIETSEDYLDAKDFMKEDHIMEDDDDGFVLGPPRPVRTSMANSVPPQQVEVPSLFSLSHPLDDVLPISNMTNVASNDLAPTPGMITDVFEKVIFTGSLSDVDPRVDYLERKEHRHSICVTYHTQKKRHAIWGIEEAQAPPPQAPLWEVSSQWRSESSKWDSHLGVVQQDLDNMDLLNDPTGPRHVADMSHYDTAARNDALADALGIRKTPRKAVEDAVPRGRSSTRPAPRSQTRPRANNNANNNNISLLSPSGRHPGNTTHDSSSHAMTLDLDASVDVSDGRPPLLTMGPFASLHPRISMTCLHEDSKMTNEAVRVFVASNAQGSGRLTICLQCPTPEGSTNPHVLRLFPFEVATEQQDKNGQIFAEKYVMSSEIGLPCTAAVPIEATPVAPSFHPHPKHRTKQWKNSALDIVLLQRAQHQNLKISLYRSNLHVVDCAVNSSDPVFQGLVQGKMVCDLENSVAGRVDMVARLDQGAEEIFRVGISLRMTSGGTNEKILSALESAAFSMLDLEPVEQAELALKLRSDCVRLEQHLSCTSHDDFGAEAIGTVVLALLRMELDLSLPMDTDQPSVAAAKANESAWERLTQSQFHLAYEANPPDGISQAPLRKTETIAIDSKVSMSMLSKISSLSLMALNSKGCKIAKDLVASLHFLYEDLKLSPDTRDVGLPAVESILRKICQEVGHGATYYASYYRLDFGESFRKTVIPGTGQQVPFLDLGQPFSIHSWLDSLLSGSKNELRLKASSINEACTRLRAFVRIYQELYKVDPPSDNIDTTSRDVDVVRILVEEGISDQTMLKDSLSPGTVLPLLEVLNRCRASHTYHDLRAEHPSFWALIGREDLLKNSEIEKSATSGIVDVQQGNDHNDIDNQDGLSLLEQTSSMLFPDDNRLKEVGRLLRSSRPVYLSVPRAIEVSDHDYERMKQEKLMLLSRRILALPIGRGMATIGNLRPVPAEPLPLPELCLVGRVPPTNAMLALDMAECPSEMKMWPEFNNGVAAGLRLPLGNDVGEDISKITRTWIVYNRPGNQHSSGQASSNQGSSPPDLGHAHGGLLMALGLRGHLTTLEMTDIFDYLTQGSVTTTVGVLLGMAANMRGTCDMSVSKMLCLHIPSLIPQHFSSIDVSSAVQAAAVSGAGLLYQGSSHRMMTEFLLNEIGKRPSNDVNVVDREAYTLSCGIALGMVNLSRGEGNGNAGLADLRIEERLYRYVTGGVDDMEMRRKREEGDRLSLPTTSTVNGNEKCSCVYEGDSINTDITSPAATLALGLIYLKTGNKSIASVLALPDTRFLLEYVRPDFLMLRVVARSLILWDDVVPSSSWIESQLPSAVKDAYVQMREQAEYLAQRTQAPQSKTYKEFDRQAVRIMYAHVIAGACFSIGLCFAGTGNQQAAEAIFERVMEFRDLRDGVDAVSCTLRPPSPIMEMCLSCVALSLAMVMSGTGDLDVLRLLKVLRWKCNEDIQYGSHTALNAAIGLLFLGGGTCTLGREPQDIAALLLAFYPRFPSSTADNQYHLQALRNLYALATKRRDIQGVDVDTNKCVFVPIEIRYRDNMRPPLKTVSPCLLANSSVDATEIHVSSDRYYPVSLKLRKGSHCHIFYVKRRSGYLNHKQDPDSKRSLLVQTGSLHARDPMSLVASFTNDKTVIAFAKNFCGIFAGTLNTDASRNPFSNEGFRRRLLFEALTRDTHEALPLYFELRVAIDCALRGASSKESVFSSWDFRLIKSYFKYRNLLTDESTPYILNTEIVAYLCELLEHALHNCVADSPDLTKDVKTGPASILYHYPTSDLGEIGDDIMDLS